MPPWLREQLARLEQLQQNLRSVQMQKQQIDAELSEADRALEALTNAEEGEQVYKYAGNLLVKVPRETIMKELQEKKELSNTQVLMLNKNETRFKDNIKELETKIDEMLKGRAQQPSQAERSSSS